MNARVALTDESLKVGSVATYTCDVGYELFGYVYTTMRTTPFSPGMSRSLQLSRAAVALYWESDALSNGTWKRLFLRRSLLLLLLLALVCREEQTTVRDSRSLKRCYLYLYIVVCV